MTFQFVRDADIEGDKNRGWRVDRLTALLEGQEVGYLKISYIARDRFARYYPTIFNYMDQILGQHTLPFAKRTARYSDLSDQELKKLLWYSNQHWSSSEPEGTREELLKMVALREQDLLKGRVGKQLKEFKAFHLDKPLVDYIHVEAHLRRRGIGTALYLEGARWMAEQGMKLYRSGIQTPEASDAWDKLERMGLTGKDRARMFVKPVT